VRISTPVGSLVNIDWLYQIRQNRGFIAGGEQAGAVGAYSHIQLYNPANSGRVVIIKKLFVSVDVSALVHVRTYDTALATLITTGINLATGGSAGAGQLKKTTNAAILGTFVVGAWVPSGQIFELVKDWWFLLNQATGILIVPDSANNKIQSWWEWTEIDA